MNLGVKELESSIRKFIGFNSRLALEVLPTLERRAQKLRGQELLSMLAAEVPGAALSLTHSNDLIAAVAAGVPKGEGIGIDLERGDRAVSPDLFKRFRSPGEDALPIAPIALWCAKEACFKANAANAGSVIRQYRVTAFLPARELGEASEGFARFEKAGLPRRHFRFIIIPFGEWVMAVAMTHPSALS